MKASNSIIVASMLTIALTLFLSQGWASAITGFINDKIGGGETLTNGNALSTPGGSGASGFGSSAGAGSGLSGGGGARW